jgi:hypothetical protein
MSDSQGTTSEATMPGPVIDITRPLDYKSVNSTNQKRLWVRTDTETKLMPGPLHTVQVGTATRTDRWGSTCPLSVIVLDGSVPLILQTPEMTLKFDASKTFLKASKTGRLTGAVTLNVGYYGDDAHHFFSYMHALDVTILQQLMVGWDKIIPTSIIDSKRLPDVYFGITRARRAGKRDRNGNLFQPPLSVSIPVNIATGQFDDLVAGAKVRMLVSIPAVRIKPDGKIYVDVVATQICVDRPNASAAFGFVE